MMKKVILHIGHAKTSTTSIQDTFKHNSHILENYGYYYPILDGLKNHNKLFVTLFTEDLHASERENLLLTFNLHRSIIEDVRSDLKSWLTDRLLESSATTIIFSSENLPNFNESELEAIKAFFNKTLGEVEFAIYAYTRDPVAYASSAYQQRARLFPSDTNAIYFPYEEKISRYLKVFGRKYMNLYKFEDACKYPKGPVCFLLNKIGLKDEVIDQMQIHRKNDSMSDVAVDLFTYSNRKIPLTKYNIKKGLRRGGDCKHLVSLPGRKFQLLEEDTVQFRDKTRSNMIWLKENFNITYSFDHKLPKYKCLEFDDDYVEKMIGALRKSNPIIRKLIYGYIRLRISENNLDVKSQNNLLILESHIKDNYYLIIKLSYSQICKALWIIRFLYRPLKRFLFRKFSDPLRSRRPI